MAAICVFCGSQSGVSPEYAAAADEFGRLLAQRSHTLVYGGGSLGMMGALADSVMAAGGHVIGVIPEHLAKVEIMHSRVPDMRITADMHQRKATMHSLADVYVALPGGFGTLEELFEVVTWAQLELHSCPIAVLNIAGYFDGLLALMATMTREKFISATCGRLFQVFNSVDELMHWIDLPGRIREADH